MSKDNSDFVLPNGFCFIAVTLGNYGMWRKARDPITAIRDAFRANGSKSKGCPVAVYYGKHDEISCSGFNGALKWKRDGTVPVVVGIYKVTTHSIKPLKRGDFGNDHPDQFTWMNDTIQYIEAQ
tara:strand:+ start:183 stop:554 length:372 start_codon:yes stop_codon:yes gene_type:complete